MRAFSAGKVSRSRSRFLTLSRYVLISSSCGVLSVGGGFFILPSGFRMVQKMAKLTWIFTYSKVIEFLDTVFMILEGRMRQVSFLHVYHHVSIFTYWFAILWAGPGSDAYFSLAINSYIHVLMYGYYFLASFGYQPCTSQSFSSLIIAENNHYLVSELKWALRSILSMCVERVFLHFKSYSFCSQGGSSILPTCSCSSLYRSVSRA